MTKILLCLGSLLLSTIKLYAAASMSIPIDYTPTLMNEEHRYSTSKESSTCSGSPIYVDTRPFHTGLNKIKGMGTPSKEATDVFIYAYLVQPGITANPDIKEEPYAFTHVDTNGSFTLDLPNQVDDGQTLILIQSCKQKDLLPTEFDRKIVPVERAPGKGRSQKLFTFGALLSNQNESYSSSNLFASFTLDNTWFLPRNYGCIPSPVNCAKFPLTNTRAFPQGKIFSFNTIFDARLTAIPVSSSTKTTETDTKSMTNASRLEPRPRADSSSQDSTFLNNKKSARFSFGWYSPHILARWQEDSKPHGLFWAPIFKAGFDTLTDTTKLSKPSQESSTASSGSTETSSSSSQEIPRLYNFYGGGVRIGSYQLHNDPNIAPELVNHIDIMIGKYSNLTSLVKCNHGNDTCRGTIPRLSFEGMLRTFGSTEGLPIYIGFSANIGQRAIFGGDKIRPDSQPGDDLRFLFGTRLDLGKLKLPTF